MIRGAVREAGDRAKVAVYSRERDVDPVGACVGMKGTRVQSIIRELRGEKIDIVEWSEDPILFVTNAISPAKVQRVSIVDDGERVMEVIVEDKQLSLAIGKKGQNVRLAAKLTGWKIDIKSEEEKRREVELQLGALEIGEPAREAGSRQTARPARRRPKRASRIERRRSQAEADAEGESRSGAEARPRRRRRRLGGSRARRCAERDVPRRTKKPAKTSRATAERGELRATDARRLKRKLNGNSPDLQGRGAAQHLEPGSDRAVEARSRHRGQERIEHDRRGRRTAIRRAAGASAQHHRAVERLVRRHAGRRPRGGSRPARRPEPVKPVARAAAAAPGQDRQAGGAAAGRRRPPPRRRGGVRLIAAGSPAAGRPSRAPAPPPRQYRESSHRSRSEPVAGRGSARPSSNLSPPSRSRTSAIATSRAPSQPPTPVSDRRRPQRRAGADRPPLAARRRSAPPHRHRTASCRRRCGCGSKIRGPGRRRRPRRAGRCSFGRRRNRAAAGGHRKSEPAAAPPARPAAPARRRGRARPPQRRVRAGLPPRPPMGGPRPLPSQPVRPRPPQRPGVPGYRPPARRRPSAPRASAAARREPRPQHTARAPIGAAAGHPDDHAR